jgi:DNA-binding transcriptional LysR family regulator
MRVTLDSLEALEAIDNHGSFAAAAKALHKVQSAVSYAVRQLEEAVGVDLFDRTGHRATLTDAGRAVLEEGRRLLAGARRIETLATRLREDWEPRVEIVIDGILPMEPIMKALRAMTDDAVPTHIQIKVEFLGGVQDRFDKDRADIMLVKDYVRSERLVEHALREVEVVLVAAVNHPLAVAGRTLTLADLQAHVELTVHDSSDDRRIADAHQFGGPRVFVLSDFATKKRAILMGLGYGWMPAYLVQRELAAGVLREIAYGAGSRYAFAPRLVHPADRPLGRAGSTFMRLLTQS